MAAVVVAAVVQRLQCLVVLVLQLAALGQAPLPLALLPVQQQARPRLQLAGHPLPQLPAAASL